MAAVASLSLRGREARGQCPLHGGRSHSPSNRGTVHWQKTLLQQNASLEDSSGRNSIIWTPLPAGSAPHSDSTRDGGNHRPSPKPRDQMELPLSKRTTKPESIVSAMACRQSLPIPTRWHMRIAANNLRNGMGRGSNPQCNSGQLSSLSAATAFYVQHSILYRQDGRAQQTCRYSSQVYYWNTSCLQLLGAGYLRQRAPCYELDDTVWVTAGPAL
jgi:hypothetical protein